MISSIHFHTEPKPIHVHGRRSTGLNRYLMVGWVGYFKLDLAKSHCEKLDQRIRRRLRMYLWKQWKRVRTRLRELGVLGFQNGQHGRWRIRVEMHGEIARNTNNALPTSYWEAKGLKSLLLRYLELR